MEKKSSNKNLHNASKAKKDEFYTQLSDIEKEMKNYKKHFKGKVIFCNCDDPFESNFFRYFAENFEYLGIKKLISTHFDEKKSTYKLEVLKDINKDGKINMEDTIRIDLKQNGDFRSDECVEILKEVDIVVTNPPFSLFREYVAQLIEYKKKFIIIGSTNSITYKDIFKLIKENKIWLGHGFKGGNAYFKTSHDIKDFASGVYNSETELVKFRNVNWFTNLDIQKRHEDLILFKTYKGNEKDYPEYDNYDAINIDITKEIPMDYKGVMGVPITFMDKYNPEQFEIVKFRKGDDEKDLVYIKDGIKKNPYFRILIKNKKI